MSARAILSTMIPFPKPRGFWDYALFASIMTGILSLLFWMEASNGTGWADAALACATAVLFVFATILARRGERARWIAHPTWLAYLLVYLGAFALIFGSIYADAYLFHRGDLTSKRLGSDISLFVVLAAAFIWSSRRRIRAKRQAL